MDVKAMTDAQIAEYLRDAALAMGEIAMAKNIKIDVITRPDGYISLDFGEYEYVKSQVREQLDFIPCGDGHPHWMLDIAPEQVVIGGEPKEAK